MRAMVRSISFIIGAIVAQSFVSLVKHWVPAMHGKGNASYSETMQNLPAPKVQLRGGASHAVHDCFAQIDGDGLLHRDAMAGG